jgi:dihydrofolate reductase
MKSPGPGLALYNDFHQETDMRKVNLAEFVSLDSVIEEPAWTTPYWNDEIAKYKFDELFASDTLLLGRVTYQGFAAAWPTMKDEQGFADRMNNLPKIVVSTTLQTAEWNNSRIVKDDVFDEVSRLKQQPGQDILIFGSGTLANSLMQHNLIDEYSLLVYPVVLASGKRLFQAGTRLNLKLVETKSFSSGVVLLRYQPG